MTVNRYEQAAQDALKSNKTLGQMLRDLPAQTAKDDLQKYSEAYVAVTIRELPKPETKAAPTKLQESNSRGSVFKDRKSPTWFVRFYTGEVGVTRSGKKSYLMKTIRLGSTSAKDEDFIRTKGEAGKKGDAEVAKFRANAAKLAESSGKKDYTVEQYYNEVVLPIWQHNLEVGEMKPSTVNGYTKSWEYYVQPKLGKKKMSEFDTVAASRFLEEMASKGLGTNTFAHARFVAQRIFGIAAGQGVVPVNPFDSAENFKKPKAAQPTKKYTAREIGAILGALKDKPQAQVAVALCYFGGLRPGEARAVRWENYYGDGLRIEQSQWRTKLGAPKTEGSVRSLTLEFPLDGLLNLLREESGNPKSGFILAGQKNAKALNFEWLAREVIRPTLKAAGIEWEGFYACRRGCATDIMSTTKDAQGSAGMLGHKNTRVTVNNYIGISPEHRTRAAKALSANYVNAQKLLETSEE
jgi:integrase